MFDTHIHVAQLNPGIEKSLSPRLDAGPPAVALDLQAEMQRAGVGGALAMGSMLSTDEDPLGLAGTRAVMAHGPGFPAAGLPAAGLLAAGFANPAHGDAEWLGRVEKELAEGQVRALKVYLGYLHVGPEHPAYYPYYRLAQRYGLPVIFHTGDTYSARAKLKFSHPLRVDEVAVDFPQVNFVLAHFGNPWLMDAAEVIYKNDNVWADLSGFIDISADYLSGEAPNRVWSELAQRVGEAYRCAEKPQRFLYGSDWPLVSMLEYQEFIRRIIPEADWPAVFDGNARRLFRL